MPISVYLLCLTLRFDFFRMDTFWKRMMMITIITIPRFAVLSTTTAQSVTNTWEMMETISLRIKKHKKKPYAILLKIF